LFEPGVIRRGDMRQCRDFFAPEAGRPAWSVTAQVDIVRSKPGPTVPKEARHGLLIHDSEYAGTRRSVAGTTCVWHANANRAIVGS
jgi:hypothetical protein